ncbi:MAG: hypothetical protein ACTSR8_20940 [Promethearchaeota archaeon]
MTRSIKELGDSQRCKKCNNFGKIVALKMSPKVVKVLYLCENCIKNFSGNYTTEEFINMANGFLVDDKWVKDYQRKYMIFTGEFLQLKGGLDGAYFSKNKNAVKKYGKNLICKCGEFYKMNLLGHKKDKLSFILECNECGKKKFKIERKDFFELGHAGIIPTSIITTVKDILETDDMEWNATEEYYTPATVLSSDARGRLGMEEDELLDELEGLLCPKCGAAISIEMKKFGKCPTCGAPLK